MHLFSHMNFPVNLSSSIKMLLAHSLHVVGESVSLKNRAVASKDWSVSLWSYVWGFLLGPLPVSCCTSSQVHCCVALGVGISPFPPLSDNLCVKAVGFFFL